MSKKLSKFKEITGEVITDEPSELENQSHKTNHKVSLASQYKEKLSEMTLEDLQSLASELGLIPLDNRDALIKSIKKEFRKS